MQLHIDTARLSRIRAFATSTHCPRCCDLMVAPYMSEFVEGGEIRHHWECDACGHASSIAITLTTH
jgi:transposase